MAGATGTIARNWVYSLMDHWMCMHVRSTYRAALVGCTLREALLPSECPRAANAYIPLFHIHSLVARPILGGVRGTRTKC